MSNANKITAKHKSSLLSAREAAKRLSCSADYVGKLCRDGKLEGQRIDNAWFVSAASLAAFEMAREEGRAARSQALARERQKEKEAYTKSLSAPAPVQPTRAPTPVRQAPAYRAPLNVAAPVKRSASRIAVFALGAACLFASMVYAGEAALPHTNSGAAAVLTSLSSPFFGNPLATSTIAPSSENFFAGILAFLFGNHSKVAVAPSTPVQTPVANTTPSTPAAAGPTTPAPPTPQTPAQAPTQTIVENKTYPITQRTIEHTIEKTVSGLTQADLDAAIAKVNNQLLTQISLTTRSMGNGAGGGGGTSSSVTNVNNTYSATSSGSTGAVQFNASGAFAADASNFFWDNSSKRLGIGTSTPLQALSLGAGGRISVTSNDGSSNGCFAQIGGQLQYSNDCTTFQSFSASAAGGWTDTGTVVRLTSGSEQVAIGTSTPYAKLTVWGSGTGAENAFEIANSASSTVFAVTDNGVATAQHLFATGSSTLQNVSLQNASSTSFYTTAFGLGGSYLTSFTGTGLVVTNGVLTVSTSSLGLTSGGFSGGTLTAANIISTSTATSTFAGGINVSGEIIASGLSISGNIQASSLGNCTLKTDSAGNVTCGTDLTSGGSGTDVNWTFFNGSGIHPATTTNQIVIGGSATSSLAKLEVTGNTYLSGSLGIGTTSPYLPLSVAGSGVIGGFLRVSSIVSTSTATSTFGGGINLATGCFAVNGTCVGTGGGSATLAGLTDVTVSTPVFGNVLQYDGVHWINVSTSSLGITGGSSSFSGGTLTAANIVSTSTATSTFVGGINLATSAGCLAINGTCLSTGSLTNYWSLSGNNLTNNSGTNIGINTASPSYALDVTGSINLDGNSSYRQNGATILAASSTNFGTLVGIGAGASSRATALYNTAVGYQALNANVSSSRLTAIGYQTLLSNITGADNTALGYSALANNVSGSQNSAFGSGSLLNNVTGSNNTGIGYNSLNTNTTGVRNTAIGSGALSNSVAQNDNTAIGYNALSSNTGGSNNTAIGSSALANNTSGTQNIGIGGSALSSNTSGSQNVGIGVNALSLNTTGVENVGIGLNALAANTTGVENVGISSNALAANTTGVQNIAVGKNALTLNTTGFQNSAYGYNALGSNTSGTQNSAFGVGALYNNGAATSSVAIGYRAGFGVSGQTASQNNTFVGFQAGFGNTTGSSNTLLGYSAGSNLTTGSGNTVLGYNLSAPSATASNQLVIANLLYGTSADGTGTKYSTGQIGVGSSSPFARLSVHANNGDTNTVLFAIGSSTQAATTTLFAVDNVGLATVTNLILTGSTTLQNVTAVNATTTNATSTSIYASTIATPNLVVSSSILAGTTTLTNLSVTNTSTSTFAGGLTLAGTGFVYQQATGNVGIGVLNPFNKFDVAGNAVIGAGYAGVNTAPTNGLLVQGSVGIGTTSPSATFAVQGNQYTSGTAFFGGAITATSTLTVTGLTTLGNASTTQIGSTASAYFATLGGRVGVGTTSPSATFAVQGNSYHSGTSFFGGAITATSTLTIADIITSTATAANIFPYASSTALTATTLFATNFTASGSTTLLNFTGVNATTSQATTTSFFASVASSTNLFATTALFNSTTLGSLTVTGNSTLNNTLTLSSVGKNMLLTTDASGNVVSSSTPTAANYLATSTTATSTFAGQLAVGSNALNVLTTGNVGIGTASPLTKLFVTTGSSGASAAANSQLTVESAANTGISLLASAAGSSAINFGNTDSATRGSISYRGSGAGTSPDTMVLTTAGAFAFSGGAVGIGTQTPGTFTNVGALVLNGSSGSTIQLQNNTTNALKLSSDASGTYLNSQTALPLEFFTNNLERMRIDSSGNIGIGTTTPSATFAVQGNGLFSGNLTLANIIATGTLQVSGNTTLANATSTSTFATTASSSNLFATAASFGTLVSGNATHNGTLNVSGIITSTATAANIFPYASSTALTVSGTGYFGTVGIGSSSPSATFAVQGNQYTSGTSFFGGAITATSTLTVTGLTTLGNASTTQLSSTASAYFATLGGSVGVGTTSPSATFAVQGNGLFSGTLLGSNITATGTLLVSGASTLNSTLGISGAITSTANTANIFPYASSTALTATTFFATNFNASGSTTLQNFTGVNATTSQATTTSFFATTASSTNLFSTTGSFGTLAAGNTTIGGTLNISGAITSTANTANVLPYASSTALTVSGQANLGSLAGAVVSSLTNNFVPKWNAGTFANTIISDTGTAVGIGTTTPSATFAVQGNGLFSGTLLASNITATGTLSVSGNTTLANATTTSIFSTTASSTNLFSTTGSFGTLAAGNTTVGGTLNISGAITSTANTANVLPYASSTALTATTLFATNFNASGSTTLQNFTAVNATTSNATSTSAFASVASSTNLFATAASFGTVAAGNTAVSGTLTVTGFTGIGTSTPWGLLSVNANALASGAPQFVVGSSTRTNFIVTNAGQVAIASTSANHTLDINGNLGIAAGGYINFGNVDADTGGAGFGFREVGGHVQFKQSGGIWADVGSGGGGGSFTTNAAGDIYFVNTAGHTYGNVGIGTTTPGGAALQVASSTGVQLLLTDSSAGVNLKHFYASSTQGSLAFGTLGDNLVTQTELFRIDGVNKEIKPGSDNTTKLGTSTLRFRELNLGGFGSAVNFWQANGTNYEKGSVGFATTTGGNPALTIQTTQGGSGVNRDIVLTPGAGAGLYLSAGGQTGLGYSTFDSSVGNALLVNGRVGVGTTSPQSALAVAANGIASGDLQYAMQILNNNSNTSGTPNQATRLLFGGQGGSAGNNWIIGTDVNANNTNAFFIATSSGPSANAAFQFTSDGAIKLANTGSVVAGNKLYAQAGGLYWDGTQLNGAGITNYLTQNATTNYLANWGNSLAVGSSTAWGRLAVAGAAGGTTPLFNISSTTSANATSTAFIIDANGKVGIGTTTPAATFALAGNEYIAGSSTINTALTVNGTVAITSTTSAGAIIPNGPYTTNLAAYDLGATASRWNAVWAGTYNVGTSTFSLKSDANSNLGIFTAASGGGTQALTVTSAGSVGIGTTSPGGKLEVNSGQTLNGVSLRSGASGSYTGYSLGRVGAEAYFGVAGAANNWVTGTAAGDIGIVTAANTQKIFISSSGGADLVVSNGKVGIGTTSPQGILHVNMVSGNDSSAPKFFADSATVGQSSEIMIGQSMANYSAGLIRYINGAGTAASAVMELFHYGDSAGSGVNILGGGNVGIGSTTPASKLSVAGQGYFTTNVGVGTNATDATIHALEATNNSVAILQTSSAVYSGDVLKLTADRSASTGFNFINAQANGSTKFVIRGDGSFGLGTNSFPFGELLSISTPNTQAIHIDESTGSNSVNLIYLTKQGVNIGAAYYNGSTVAWQTTSDRRLKENIVPTTGGLDTLLKIPVYNFNYKTNPGHTVEGFIAQDVYPYYPQIVHATDDGVSSLATTSEAWSIDYSGITPLLVQSIKDVNAKVDAILNGTATSTITNVAYANASTTATDTLCLGGDCRTAWPVAASSTALDLSGYATLNDLSVNGAHSQASLSAATSSIYTSLAALSAQVASLPTTTPDVSGFVTGSQLASAISAASPNLSSFVSTSSLASTLSGFATNSALTAAVASATSTLYNQILALMPAPVTLANLHGTVTGDIIPNADVAYTLGTPTNRFTNIYAQYINAGDLTFTETTNPVGMPAHTFVPGEALALFVTTTAGSTHTVPVDFTTALNLGVTGSAPVYFNTTGGVGVGIASTTALRGKLDVEASIASGDARLFTLANTSGANGNAALPYSAYIPSATGDLNIASNDNGNGSLVNSSYSAWDLKIGGQSDTFSIARSASGAQSYSSLLSLTSAGSLGIGTTSPTAKFALQGTAGTGQILDIASSTGASLVHLMANGNFGVGTSTPFAKLSVNPLAGDAAQFVVGSSTRTSFIINNAGNVGVGTTSPSTTFALQGNQYTSGTAYFGGAITATSTLTVTGLSTLGNASTTQIGSTGSSYFATSGGNVGIGTTTPGNALTVASAGFPATFYNTGTDNRIFLQHSGTGMGNQSGLMIGEIGDDSYFYNYRSGNTFLGTNGTTQMTVTSAGKVGVGTTSPSTALSVAGSGYFTTGVNIGTNTAINGGSLTILGPNGVNMGIYRNASNVQNSGLVFGTTPSTVDYELYTPANSSDLTFNSGGDRVTFTSAGTVGIGTVSPGVNQLSVLASGSNNAINGKVTAAGGVAVYGESTSNVSNGYAWFAYNSAAGTYCYVSNDAATHCVSDERLKKNIAPISGALDKLSKIQGVSFQWKSASSSQPDTLGVIAQNVLTEFPELVQLSTAPGTTTAYYTVNYQGLIAPLIQGVNELNNKVEANASSTVHISGGVINLSAAPATTTIAVGTNAWTIATSSTSTPIVSISTGDATTAASVSINGTLFVNGVDIASAVASSSATTTPAALATNSLSSVSDTVKAAISSALAAISNISQVGVRQLGAAVYASVGVFNNLFAQTITVDTVTAQKLCLGTTCVNEQQLQGLLNGTTGTTGTTSTNGSGGSSSSTPPVVTLNGASPATVAVGTTYADLGGVVSGPGTDSNLQLMASVDGAATTTASQITIDTSAAGNHSIIYSATDGAGQSGYATRTVNVVAATSTQQ